MKKIHLLLLAGAGLVTASCTHETVVYRTKEVPVKQTYVRTYVPTYVERTYIREAPSSDSPTTLPGSAQRIPEANAPDTFKAESAQ